MSRSAMRATILVLTAVLWAGRITAQSVETVADPPHRTFNVYGGINTVGGSRSLMGSHPFWLANDRVLADEFFRPGFTGAAWANGAIAPGLWYSVAVGNSLSQLGFTARQLTRDLATGQTVWWMPTTGEFGPNGSYSDWEYREDVATRFGASNYRSRETRHDRAGTTSRRPDAW